MGSHCRTYQPRLPRSSTAFHGKVRLPCTSSRFPQEYLVQGTGNTSRALCRHRFDKNSDRQTEPLPTPELPSCYLWLPVPSECWSRCLRQRLATRPGPIHRHTQRLEKWPRQARQWLHERAGRARGTKRRSGAIELPKLVPLQIIWPITLPSRRRDSSQALVFLCHTPRRYRFVFMAMNSELRRLEAYPPNLHRGVQIHHI
jgi:hypothetical protein